MRKRLQSPLWDKIEHDRAVSASTISPSSSRCFAPRWVGLVREFGRDADRAEMDVLHLDIGEALFRITEQNIYPGVAAVLCSRGACRRCEDRPLSGHDRLFGDPVRQSGVDADQRAVRLDDLQHVAILACRDCRVPRARPASPVWFSHASSRYRHEPVIAVHRPELASNRKRLLTAAQRSQDAAGDGKFKGIALSAGPGAHAHVGGRGASSMEIERTSGLARRILRCRAVRPSPAMRPPRPAFLRLPIQVSSRLRRASRHSLILASGRRLTTPAMCPEPREHEVTLPPKLAAAEEKPTLPAADVSSFGARL